MKIAAVTIAWQLLMDRLSLPPETRIRDCQMSKVVDGDVVFIIESPELPDVLLDGPIPKADALFKNTGKVQSCGEFVEWIIK